MGSTDETVAKGLSMSFSATTTEVINIFYREVSTKDELEHDTIDSEGDVTNVQDLLSAVHDNVQYTHSLSSLDVTSYFIDWIRTVLERSTELNNDIPDNIKTTLEYIAEDFSDNMKSRARERGKYVVFILTSNSLIVCHSFTGKKALTTDMDVIEELLSEANIDKYARFVQEKGENIEVEHFDRHDTESFSEWLGIPEDEIAFDVKGSVRIHTSIDGIDAVFEFDQNDISTKLLGSDEYDLSEGMLKTPNEEPRRVEHIQWGHKRFANVESFKQELLKTNYNIVRAFNTYDKHISDSLDSFFTVIDHQDKIVKETSDTPTVIRKPNADFELSFVNAQVEMDAAWRSDLARKIMSKHDPIPICHAGSPFDEMGFPIGNLRIYNELDITPAQQQYIIDLMRIANDMGSANLRPLFCHILFELLSKDVSKPLCYLFSELSDEFLIRFQQQVRDETRIIQTEEEDIDFEQKSPPWFERDTSIESLAEGIHREFQNSRLILIGITEDTKEINVIESGITSEKLNKIENTLETEYGLDEPHVWAIPIGDGHILLALNVEQPTGAFDTSIAVLEPT